MKPQMFESKGSLLAEAERRLGWQDALRIADSFQRVGLPAPEKGEFTRTSEGGYLVFADHFGLAIRMTLHSWPHAVSDVVLQPLGRFDTEFFRFDINPGVTTPGRWEDYCEHVYPVLRQEKRQSRDSHPDNIGYLSDRDGSCVVIDTPNVYSDGTPLVSPTPRQNKLFGSLKRSFANALKKENPAIFLKACLSAKADGVLVAEWCEGAGLKKSERCRNEAAAFRRKVIQPARRYDARLRNTLNS
jgi:hypothetical protein